MAYYIAKVKVVVSDTNGKPKKSIEQYLVNAVSITDAESKVHSELADCPMDFEVSSIAETKILQVID